MDPSLQRLIACSSWLLDRPLTAEDGLPERVLQQAEHHLGCPLPTPLRDFYRYLGQVEGFTAAFQRFASPQQLHLHQGRLVFLEENQQVCHWSVDAAGTVYQVPDLDAPDAYPEPLPLDAFLHAMLYYQQAQGGYPYCALRPMPATPPVAEWVKQQMPEARSPVVDSDGLCIWACPGPMLLWCLQDEHGMTDVGLYLSALHPEPFQQACSRWGFDDLG